MPPEMSLDVARAIKERHSYLASDIVKARLVKPSHLLLQLTLPRSLVAHGNLHGHDTNN